MKQIISMLLVALSAFFHSSAHANDWEMKSLIGTYRGGITTAVATGRTPVRFDLIFVSLNDTNELTGFAVYHNASFSACTGKFPIQAKKEEGKLIVTIDRKTNSACNEIATFTYTVSSDLLEITSRTSLLKKIN